jgi:hypothetical protein
MGRKLGTACIPIEEAIFHKNTLPSVIFVYFIRLQIDLGFTRKFALIIASVIIWGAEITGCWL